MSNDAPGYDPVFFEQFTGGLIRLVALHTHNAAGSSGEHA